MQRVPLPVLSPDKRRASGVGAGLPLWSLGKEFQHWGCQIGPAPKELSVKESFLFLSVY